MKKEKKETQDSSQGLNREQIRLCLRELHPDSPEALPADVLQNIIFESESPGEDLAWLAAYDLDPEVSSHAVTALFFAIASEDFPTGMSLRVQKGAAPVLLKALKSTGVPDERKCSLGPLYSSCVDGLSVEEYRSFFKDFEGMAAKMLSQAVDSISCDPEAVERVLDSMQALADDGLPEDSGYQTSMRLAAHMVKSKPSAAATLLGASLVRRYESEVGVENVDAALSLMEKTNCPQAVWLLDEIGRWPGLGELGKKAQRLAVKMKLTGLSPDYALDAHYSHGIITGPDPTGARQVLLFFRTPHGGMDALVVMFRDDIGIKDTVCIYENGAEVEDEFRDKTYELPSAPCTLNLAREFVANAWAIHAADNTSFPSSMFIYRPYLGKEQIVPNRRTHDLSAYGLDALKHTPALVEQSETLMDLPCYGMFTFHSDRAYEYVAGVAPKRSPRLSKKNFETFLKEIAIDEKKSLDNFLAATLETMSWAGRATQNANQLAARTWLGLVEETCPFPDIPYVRALAETSIGTIIENLRAGFHNQEEADAAYGEEYGNLLDALE